MIITDHKSKWDEGKKGSILSPGLVGIYVLWLPGAHALILHSNMLYYKT